MTFDVYLLLSDIGTCHRFDEQDCQKSKKTIIRFLNKKNAKKMLINKKKLKNLNNKEHNSRDGTKIFSNENLTPMSIAFHCRQSKCNKLIYACYSRNGVVQTIRREANL